MTKKLNRVLLVDDDEANNFYNNIFLKQHNPEIEIESLTNGEELINYIKNENNKEWPITLFLDLNMHLVDGPEFLEWYHTNNHEGKMNIIMFSASVLPEDINRCMAYQDVKKYFEKPLNNSKLEEILSELD